MADNFWMEEYKMLRAKSQNTIARMEDLERNVVLFCGAVFVFAVGTFKATFGYQSVFLYFLPMCVSIVAFVRYRGLKLYVKAVNDYTMTLEKKLGDNTGGWLVHYYGANRTLTDTDYQRYRSIIWIAIILFNAVAGLGLAMSLIFPSAINACMSA